MVEVRQRTLWIAVDEEEENEAGGGRRRQEAAGGGRRQDAAEGRRGGRRQAGGRQEEEATDIKSNNPHLAGGEKYAKLIRLKTLNTLRNLRSVWLKTSPCEVNWVCLMRSPKIPFSSSWRPLHAAGGIVQGSHLGEGQSGPSTRPLQ